LYIEALTDGAAACDLEPVHVEPKSTLERAAAELEIDAAGFAAALKAAGKTLGPPWQKDHREATAAALVALYVVGQCTSRSSTRA
jgi:hypothetical protein